MIYYGEKLYNPLILDWKFSFFLNVEMCVGDGLPPVISSYLLAALVR